MFKSEKQSEHELTNTLKHFNQDYIYYSPNHHEILKELFVNSSKTGDGIGLPDRIFFDSNTLIIFECKTDNLLQAEKDITHYINNLTKNNYIIYGVAFVSNNLYSVFKQENNKLIRLNNKLISLDTFNLKQTNETVDMKGKIHAIHNYIRATKISDEDKPFFIAIILISLSKSSFDYILKKYKNKEYIYDILLENLKDYDIDINVFNFMRNDKNNLYLHNLITMIYNLYQKNPSIDLLNEFYSEFVKYNNSDGKKLGIVLTPPHIVKLMCDMLEINKDDIVLDLCTGTGSFLLEASNSMPKKLIGVEYQNKLYALLKCNVILRKLENMEIKKGNCFDFEYKATKSLINPPYSVNGEPEYKFILKQLDSLDEGGLACAIIPVSKVTNNAQNNKYKKKIMEIAKVKKIVICRKTLFYPNANIQCCILLLEKCKSGDDGQTNIINYEDDGFEMIKQSGLVKTDRFEKKYKNIQSLLNINNLKKIKFNDDWVVDNTAIVNKINLLQLKIYELEIEFLERKATLISNQTDNNLFTFSNANEYLLIDLFVIEKKIVRFIKDNKVNDGNYNLISATKYNNGVLKKIDYYDYKGDCLTLSDLGADCSCFYQIENFSTANHIYVLRFKKKLTKKQYIIFAFIIEDTIKKSYHTFRNINLRLLNQTKLSLPINKTGTIDYDYMESLI